MSSPVYRGNVTGLSHFSYGAHMHVLREGLKLSVSPAPENPVVHGRPFPRERLLTLTKSVRLLYLDSPISHLPRIPPWPSS